ncbi:flavocytochrome c [Helcococcus kunzii]|uniref:flavocytochrome c n=1 Tax=Helcococcus kunzii TaxID=40091 RepID=UPI00389DBABB
MKKLKVLLLTLFLTLSLVACGNANNTDDKTKKETVDTKDSVETEENTDKEEASLKDGTYTGKAEGHQGPVEVEVSISDGKIADVKVTKTSESPGVAKALEIIPERIKEAQSYNVDVVSGATFASNAITRATKDCLVQAGANEDDYSEKVAFPTKYEGPFETDVIVIGGGGSGLSAAISAEENGAKVIVVEKLGQVGGSTVFAGGALNAADTERAKSLKMTDLNIKTIEEAISREPKDDYEAKLQKQLKEDYDKFKKDGSKGMFDSVAFHALQTYNGGDYEGNPDLIDTLTKEAPNAVDWLIKNGAKIDDELGSATGSLWQRSHYGTKEFPNGTYLINTYADKIEKSDNIQLHLNSKATKLIKEKDRIVGVIVERDGKEYEYKASKGVIIATGGFGANVEMRQKYNEQWDDLGKQIGCSNSAVAAQGDGIVMAEKVGAELIDMGLIQLHPNGQPGTGMMMGQPHTSGLNRIFVNTEGKRFVAEDQRRDVLVESIYKQPEGVMWIVADGTRYPEGDEKIANDVETGKTFKANTIEELAEKMEVPVENLKQSIEQYNKIVDGEKDPLGLQSYDKKLGKAPFYAAKRLPTVHHTMGGLKIDTSGRVLDKNSKPISGLFAAGEVTGDIHGANRLGGNAITDVVVFGKIAGETAAKGE